MLTSSVLTNLALLCSTVLGVHLAIPKNFADPTTINVNGKWYAFASGSNGARIPGATSPDFNNWSVTLNGANDYDYLDAIPAWCYQPSAAVAAPDINQLSDNSYIVYFDATPSAVTTYRRCIGAATASTPSGPFTPLASPVVCGTNKYGWIDASGFLDPQSGLRYLLYKLDGTNPGPPSAPNSPVPAVIYIQQVDVNDGVTPIGSATPILQSVGGTVDYGTVEAPSLVMNPDHDGYVLFYSSGFYKNSTYTVSYATSSGITGPYTTHGALLQTGTYGLNAPGGADVTPNGTLMVFHANAGDTFDGNRYMWTGRVSYEGTTVTVT